MEARPERSGQEIMRLQRCMNDLLSVLALPAMWTEGKHSQIVPTLLDSLSSMLQLDLAYVRLRDPIGNAPVEQARIAPSRKPAPHHKEIGEALNRWFGDHLRNWPSLARKQFGDGDISLVCLNLGLDGEIGVLVAGSQRMDFPAQTERLLLSVAANQATIGLQEARILSQQPRISSELDQRVAERTAELAKANDELRKEIGERKKIEERLRKSEAALQKAFDEIKKSETKIRQVVDAIPALAWCNLPDGPNEFLNKRWHDYTGVPSEESTGWGWQAAFHPEDLPPLLKKWQELLISRQPGEIEARIRRFDGVYRWFLISVEPLLDEAGRIVRWYGTSTDIEDRKLAQEALRASEAQLRRTVDTIPGLVCTMSLSGEITTLNRPLLKYFGKSPEELRSWKITNAVHPDDLPRVATAFEHSIRTCTPYEVEHRCRRADGVYRWFQVRAHPVQDKDGQNAGWYALLTDIDDRKRAEEALLGSENNLRNIVDGIPGLLYTLSPAGKIELANRQLQEYFGITVEELNAWATNGMVYPDDLQRILPTVSNTFKTGTPFDEELRYRRADGVYRWFQVRIVPVRDADGGITGFYGLITDIEDRKRAEFELQRSEAFLAEAQRITLTGSFSWCLDTDEITFSEQLYRIFEFDPDAPVTLAQINSRVHPEDIPLLYEKIELARGGISNHDYEIRLRMPDGRIKYLRTSAYGARDHHGRPEYFGAIQDVTERRVSEEALSKARSELSRVSKFTSLGVMTASIAHEINQPLSGIITNAGTCVRMLAADPPDMVGARETARRTIRDGNRMSEVVARLRALFSKKGGTIEPVDLNDATRDVIAMSLSGLQRNQVILQLELADDLPAIRGDRVQLQQVILNLVRNASDAMSTVEDRPRQLLVRTEREEENRVRLSVRDAGIGFDPHAADRIFDAFYTTKNDGMGIGLSVSSSIIQSHHGRLWAALNDGPGATFSFSLPCGHEGAASAGKNPDMSSPSATGLNVS